MPEVFTTYRGYMDNTVVPNLERRTVTSISIENAFIGPSWAVLWEGKHSIAFAPDQCSWKDRPAREHHISLELAKTSGVVKEIAMCSVLCHSSKEIGECLE